MSSGNFRTWDLVIFEQIYYFGPNKESDLIVSYKQNNLNNSVESKDT